MTQVTYLPVPRLTMSSIKVASLCATRCSLSSAASTNCKQHLGRRHQIGTDMGMGQYLLIPFLVGWTSIYQLFWGSLGTRVLTHSYIGLANTKNGNIPEYDIIIKPFYASEIKFMPDDVISWSYVSFSKMIGPQSSAWMITGMNPTVWGW